jgi:hypothetical protein
MAVEIRDTKREREGKGCSGRQCLAAGVVDGTGVAYVRDDLQGPGPVSYQVFGLCECIRPKKAPSADAQPSGYPRRLPLIFSSGLCRRRESCCARAHLLESDIRGKGGSPGGGDD